MRIIVLYDMYASIKKKKKSKSFYTLPFPFLAQILGTRLMEDNAVKPLEQVYIPLNHGPSTMNCSFYLSLYFSTIGISVGPETILTNSKVISENSLLRRSIYYFLSTRNPVKHLLSNKNYAFYYDVMLLI